MEFCIQYKNYRISLFVLPDFLLIGIGLGYTIDENKNIHKSLNIGAAFVCLAFTIIDEEPYKNLY
jgi:hypothetical protein